MPTFKEGDWGSRADEAPKRVGFVLMGPKNYKYKVSWLHHGRAEWVGAKGLRGARPPAALFFEGCLDADLRSARSEAPVLREFLRSFDMKLATKTVFSMKNLDHFSSQLQSLPFLFVHLGCHAGAYVENGVQRAWMRFSPKNTTDSLQFLDDENVIAGFRKHFAGKHVLIAACELGK